MALRTIDPGDYLGHPQNPAQTCTQMIQSGAHQARSGATDQAITRPASPNPHQGTRQQGSQPSPYCAGRV